MDARTRRAPSRASASWSGTIVSSFAIRRPSPFPPLAAVAGQQGIRLGRPPGKGLVWSDAVAGRAPRVENRRHDLPAGLDRVGAMEERHVARHAVIEQRLVAA